MSTQSATSNAGSVAPRRGDDTRERLLDAIEALIAEHGFQALTHRLIAQRADVHVALLNYHFGSKEQLVEEAIARRAPRLIQLQKDALAALRNNGVWTVEDVLWAMWQPFAAVDMRGGGAWRHYLCVVSRLASYDRGADLFSRHFTTVERECLYALHRTLPEVPLNLRRVPHPVGQAAVSTPPQPTSSEDLCTLGRNRSEPGRYSSLAG